MEKVVKTLFLTLVVLAAAGVASADFTTTVYDTSVMSEVNLGPTSFAQSSFKSSFAWAHNWAIPAIEGDIVSVVFKSAALDVTYQKSSDSQVSFTDTIHVGALSNPSLGNLANGVNSFDVSSYESLMDGSLDVISDLYNGTGVYARTFSWSKLTVVYKITERKEIPSPDPVVPAPGAIVLGSLGAGLVGWIRRRGIV